MNVIRALPPKLQLQCDYGADINGGRSQFIVSYDKRGNLYCHEEHGRGYHRPCISALDRDRKKPNRTYLEEADIVFLATMNGENNIIQRIECWSLYRVNPTMIFDFKSKCYTQTYPHQRKQEKRPQHINVRFRNNPWADQWAQINWHRYDEYNDAFGDYYKSQFGNFFLTKNTGRQIHPVPFESLFKALDLRWYWCEEIQEEEEKRRKREEYQFLTSMQTIPLFKQNERMRSILSEAFNTYVYNIADGTLTENK